MIRLELEAAIDAEERPFEQALLALYNGQLIPRSRVGAVDPSDRFRQLLPFDHMVAMGKELILTPKGDAQKVVIFPRGTPASGHPLNCRLQQRFCVGITAFGDQLIRPAVKAL